MRKYSSLGIEPQECDKHGETRDRRKSRACVGNIVSSTQYSSKLWFIVIQTLLCYCTNMSACGLLLVGDTVSESVARGRQSWPRREAR